MTVYGSAQDIQLKDLKWQNRIILIDTMEDDELGVQQRAILESDTTGVAERNVRLIFSTDATYSDKIQRALDRHRILLIGLDGSVKVERDEPLDLKTLFAIIDGMPMRQSEIDRKD